MFKKSIFVTIFVISGALINFFCQVLYGKYFGTGGDMAIYFKMNSIPTMFSTIFVSIFGSMLIPSFPEYEKKGKFSDFVSYLNPRVKLMALSVALFGIVYSVLSVINASSVDHRILLMSVLLWILVYFTIVNGFYSPVINYQKMFYRVSLTTLMCSGITLVCVFLFHGYLGVLSIPLGMILGVVIRYILFQKEVPLKKHHETFRLDYKDIGRRALYTMGVMLPFSSFAAIAYSWCGKFDMTGVSYLGYSHSFEGALSLAASSGIATVSFPDMAKNLSSSDKESRRTALCGFSSRIKLVVFITSILAVFCAFFCKPVITILLQRGEFSEDSTNGLSHVLPFYLVGGSFIALMNLVRICFYSLKRVKEFSIVAMGVTGLFFLLSHVLVGKIGYVGIGICECVMWILFFIVSIVELTVINGSFLTKSFYLDSLKYIVAPILVAVPIRFLYAKLLEIMMPFPSIVMCGILYLFTVICVLVYIFRLPEASMYTNRIFAAVFGRFKNSGNI